MPLYASPPDLRMAYDRDGSAVLKYSGGGGSFPYSPLTTVSTADAQALNSEGMGRVLSSPGAGGVVGVVVVFPELRDIIGFYADFDNNDNNDTFNASDGVSTSPNTTSGTDGTWSSWSAIASSHTFRGAKSTHRSAIIVPASARTSIKGIRFAVQYNGDTEWVNTFHLYGYPHTGENPDSLRPWHPTLNQQADGTTLDFGDMPRGVAATKTFRIKNNSSTKTAHAVAVNLEALTDSSPSLIGQFQLSTDNSSFANSISIGDLAPGAISSVLYLKDTVNAGEPVGVWDLRVVAAASTWT